MHGTYTTIHTVCFSPNWEFRIHETSRITVLYILIFRVLDNKPEGTMLAAENKQTLLEF